MLKLKHLLFIRLIKHNRINFRITVTMIYFKYLTKFETPLHIIDFTEVLDNSSDFESNVY